MIRKIVVPVDGSKVSERILPHLAELFRAADAEFRFILVSDWSEASLKRGREYLEGLEKRVADRFPYARTELLKGEPVFEIMKYAVMHHADLIAMMSRTRSEVKRLLFGSTARDLVRACQVPLYLARPEVAARPIRRILVPVDGSRTSQCIFPVVADLAAGAGAQVSLLTVAPNSELLDPARRALRRAATVMIKSGIPVESISKAGESVKGILESARDEAVDMIALGTHGRRGSQRFFFGSVTESVIEKCEVPLLLRRTPKPALKKPGPRPATIST